MRYYVEDEDIIPRYVDMKLVKEPNNMHDSNAIKVYIKTNEKEQHIGYVAKYQTRAIDYEFSFDKWHNSESIKGDNVISFVVSVTA